MTTVHVEPRSFRGRTDPLAREALFRQVGSLVGAVLLGFLSLAMRDTQGVDPGVVLRAATLTAVAVVAILVVPWTKIPAAFHVLVPLAYLGVIYLVQGATGGLHSSYAQLALLPVFWVAVFGRPRELVVVVAGAAVVLGVPVVVEQGTSREWIRLLTLIAAGSGIAVFVYRFFEGLRHQTTRLQVLAGTDPLTGAANRRAWDEELAGALVRATRDGRPVAVALLDLDDFKGFNDANGHQAGDRLLKEVASTWQGQLRASDILARIGGDEFGILLPGCPLDMAATIAQRLRDSVPEARCSIGVAEWDFREPVERLVARADSALYEAKAAGRHRVVILPETGGTVVLPDTSEPEG
ncbi:MAG: GGDEF domain-containing protein [Candidatus Velamenicoccus archaeovorus]